MKTASNRLGLIELLIATSALVALTACGGCGKQTPKPDAGNDEDSGVVVEDAGETPDAGPADAGVDGGLPDLKITKVLPPRGGSSGGTQVLIQGSGFVLGVAERATEAKKVTTIKFGSNPAIDFQIIDDQTIDVRVPPGQAKTVNVTLTNPRGTFSCGNCYTYYDELFLSSVTPKEGPLAGGTDVKITGQGFTNDVQVLFGQFSSPTVTFVSDKEIHAISPRGAVADLVDITVYNKNGVGFQRRVFQYVADLRVSSVAPPVGPLAGGTSVVVTGTGFEGLSSIKFGGVDAASFTVDSPTQITAVTPAGTAVGAVDIALVTPRESWTVKKGFTYADPAGAFDAFALSPRLGPSAGGNVVTLTGQGFTSLASTTVTVGGQPATLSNLTANSVDVTVPARGSGAAVADVVVSDGTTTKTLIGAYTYRIELASVAPNKGPAAGGTATVVSGKDFPTDLEVFFGALKGQVGGATDASANALTPAGSGGGPTALRARSATDFENEAVLPDAFTFVEALSIGRAQPDRGAIAGNTLITVLGSGFEVGTTVSFGANKAKDVKIVDSHTLTCRTPKAAEPGTVDVKVDKLTETDTLPGGFSYFDPRSVSGGLSGGPLIGTVNVTVLDITPGLEGAPVPQATVMLGTDVTTPFQGLTDNRGQITFSDPGLVKAQTVTVFKTNYQVNTVTAVNTENVTVYIAQTGGGDPSPSNPPPGTPASVISGRVTGFKPPRPLTSNEVMEARVFVAQTSLTDSNPWFGGPPFAQVRPRTNEKWIITQDNGDYLVLCPGGLHAVYAYLGVKNKQTGAFTPYVMGIKRGIQASPDLPATQNDIVLDMHLDMTVPVTIDQPITIDGFPATNSLYGYLDLGSEGFIPNPYNTASGPGGTGTGTSSISTPGNTISFPGFPQLNGDSFVFLNEAAGIQGLPVSYFFRRQPGDLRQGLTIGPMLTTPVFTAPTTDLGFTGTISWTRDPGANPDIYQVHIFRQNPDGSLTDVWQVVLPGTETQVVLPPPAVTQLQTQEAGQFLFAAIWGSRSPKFAYNQWTYDTLSTVSWSSYTLSVSEGFTP
ncbi:MAG: IPT/TIG domain-containing protein [Myxococcaceae bacterium]